MKRYQYIQDEERGVCHLVCLAPEGHFGRWCCYGRAISEKKIIREFPEGAKLCPRCRSLWFGMIQQNGTLGPEPWIPSKKEEQAVKVDTRKSKLRELVSLRVKESEW